MVLLPVPLHYVWFANSQNTDLIKEEAFTNVSVLSGQLSISFLLLYRLSSI